MPRGVEIDLTKKSNINLFDKQASHTPERLGYYSFSHNRRPKYFDYLPDGSDPENIALFTSGFFDSNFVDTVKAKLKIAWIVETRCVDFWAYSKILETERAFDYIFTFDETLLSRSDKYIKNLIASSRVLDEDCGIKQKSKDISMIDSGKRFCSGHIFRGEVYDKVVKDKPVDMWGRSHKPFALDELHKEKEEPLSDYRFSVTIENESAINYFTEKIIDCFMYGTVPIYWGCPNISDFFNMEGIITFNTLDELDALLDNMTPEYYNSILSAVQDNHERCKEYLSMDDTLAKNLDLILNSNK